MIATPTPFGIAGPFFEHDWQRGTWLVEIVTISGPHQAPRYTARATQVPTGAVCGGTLDLHCSKHARQYARSLFHLCAGTPVTHLPPASEMR